MSGVLGTRAQLQTVLLFLLLPVTLTHCLFHFVHIICVVHMLADSSADSCLPDNSIGYRHTPHPCAGCATPGIPFRHEWGPGGYV